MTCLSFTVEYFPPANTYPWRSIDRGSGRPVCGVTVPRAPTASASAMVNMAALLMAHFLLDICSSHTEHDCTKRRRLQALVGLPGSRTRPPFMERRIMIRPLHSGVLHDPELFVPS